MSCAKLFDRLQNNGAIGRLYALFIAALLAVVGFFDKGLVGVVFNLGGGSMGDFVAVLMLFACTLAAIDTFVNDVLPDNMRIPTLLHYRHLLLMCVACCCGVGSFMAVHTLEGLWVLPVFAITALVFMASAFFDIRRRFKQGQQ
jgi:hypothetical protein